MEDEIREVEFGLDGEWGLESLPQLMGSWRQLYSFAYSMVTEDTRTYTLRPFRGGFSTNHFYSELQSRIPHDQRTNLRAIRYASPGMMELYGYIGAVSAVLFLINRAINTWGNIHKTALDIQKRKTELKLSKIEADRKTILLDREQQDFVEESVDKMLEVLPFNKAMTELFKYRSRNVPLAQLNILLGIERRLARFAKWEASGQLTLPDPGPAPKIAKVKKPKKPSKKKSKPKKKGRRKR